MDIYIFVLLIEISEDQEKEDTNEKRQTVNRVYVPVQVVVSIEWSGHIVESLINVDGSVNRGFLD